MQELHRLRAKLNKARAAIEANVDILKTYKQLIAKAETSSSMPQIEGVKDVLTKQDARLRSYVRAVNVLWNQSYDTMRLVCASYSDVSTERRSYSVLVLASTDSRVPQRRKNRCQRKGDRALTEYFRKGK